MFKNLGDMAGLLKKAQKMQGELARIQEELAEKVVEGSAGGGMVKAMANGRQELLAVKIDPEVINAAEKDLLEDLVTAAVNQAMKNAADLAQQEMSKVTGGLNLPGLP